MNQLSITTSKMKGLTTQMARQPPLTVVQQPTAIVQFAMAVLGQLRPAGQMLVLQG
jgi:hypothetical protein